MDPETPAPLPGSMSVPLWFQGEVVVAVVVVAVVLALVALALGSVRPGASERAEWQSWLAARSRHADAAPPARPGGAGPLGDGPARGARRT
ncbi:hypothetical protein GCU60_13885 [Blastococcus saxobsidens]|uniref:Uncharacterized protein n=1 Tax=Blastococcus saxobsidens TaxID=138336 RepID=A0A6L9W491_9ACTN|nr:hypothetical protein [Blastococcus saxobsidens]NEK86833.1 hypothetical protein [Blastococcus saxobsidens]